MSTPDASLHGRVVRGVAWKALSQIVLQLSKIVVAVVLARLLAPHDYGIAGMVLVFSSLVFIFSDVALGSALVQRRSLDERDASTVFWTSTGLGLFFTLAGVALSWPLADFYGEPAVQPLFAALSLSFLVTALGSTQRAVLTRDMDFRRLELRMIAATIVGAIIGIGAAANGAGAWAIIGQQLAIAVVSTVALWASSPWRPRFVFSFASLKNLGGFSANVFGTRLLFYASRNADNLLVGRFLGSSALGAYALAYNLMLMPIERITGPIQEVLFPAFSRLQDDPGRLAAAWLRVNRAVAALSMPMLLGLMIAAPEFVTVVLGEKWSAAIPVLQILAWAGLLQSLQRLNSSVLQARDRTGVLLAFAFVAAGANVAAFAVGLQWGIVGVAAAYAVTNTLLQPGYTIVTARAVALPVVECVRNLWPVAQASAAMVVAVLATKVLLIDAGVGPAGRLPVLVLVGIAVFVPSCAWRAPDLVQELRQLARRGRGQARPTLEAQPSRP
jgi:O-antigen/teichoic acid export membrane protein